MRKLGFAVGLALLLAAGTAAVLTVAPMPAVAGCTSVGC
jgi:hypothetical protein